MSPSDLRKDVWLTNAEQMNKGLCGSDKDKIRGKKRSVIVCFSLCDATQIFLSLQLAYLDFTILCRAAQPELIRKYIYSGEIKHQLDTLIENDIFITLSVSLNISHFPYFVSFSIQTSHAVF